jgi:dihydrofolate reductase
MEKPLISIVAAIGKNRQIGKNNGLLWHIPEDLKRFKRLTLGHPVVMGRKTFESIVAILGKPLPGRANIVVTRDKEWAYEGATAAHSLEEALAAAAKIDQAEVFIGGGANLWEQALPLVDRLYLTLVEDDTEGDTYFPAYEDLFTERVAEEALEHNGVRYRWVDFERI